MNRIVNPKTKKYINVDGPTYNKLLEDGYTKSYLNSLKNLNNLQLNLKTDEPIMYNNDVILILIRYLHLNELFAFYHTSKQFHICLNNEIFIVELCKNYRVIAKNFMNFIHQIIYKKYKYDMNASIPRNGNWWNVNDVIAYKIIMKEYNQGNYLSMCKTKRTTKNKLCEIRNYMRRDYAKEINNLSAAKTTEAYKSCLIQLDYAIYCKLLNGI